MRFMHPTVRKSGTGTIQCEGLEPRRLLAVVNVDTVAELVAAVNNGAAGDVVNVAAGTYTLSASLAPKPGMMIQGAGAGATVMQGAGSWLPGTSTLPDNGTSASSVDATAYLFSLPLNTDNVKISGMTLTGPQLHGAVFGDDCDGLELSALRVDDFRWSGVRTFRMSGGNFHDNTFVNAGGRWQAGSPGTSGGVAGGAIYVTYASDTQIWNNHIYRTNTATERNHFGIKGRQAQNSRFHHNTIEVNFSIEFPFENDQSVEIDHNYLAGTVSIPKSGGGTVPAGGYTFHIHHNYFKKSYALEWPRNGAEVDHNLFDVSTTDDGGNLITKFGTDVAAGPTKFHNNLIKNPGRGLLSVAGTYNNFSFYNNHVIGNTTATPRTEGMFGLPAGTNFSTITIKDNIFEFNGTSRPLFRNTASYASVIENNTLTNVSDAGSYANPSTGATRGPTAPLSFTLGANNAYTLNGWSLTQSSSAVTVAATEDSYANSGSVNANYGNSTAVRVKNASNDFRSYLKFNLAGLGSIQNAKLRLWCSALSGTPTTASVYGVANDTWQEATLNWSNAPAVGAALGSGVAITAAGAWYEWDVTSFIQAEAAGDATASLAIFNDNSKTIDFSSSEAGTNSPQLVINGSSLASASASLQPASPTQAQVRRANERTTLKKSRRLTASARPVLTFTHPGLVLDEPVDPVLLTIRRGTDLF